VYNILRAWDIVRFEESRELGKEAARVGVRSWVLRSESHHNQEVYILFQAKINARILVSPDPTGVAAAREVDIYVRSLVRQVPTDFCTFHALP